MEDEDLVRRIRSAEKKAEKAWERFAKATGEWDRQNAQIAAERLEALIHRLKNQRAKADA